MNEQRCGKNAKQRRQDEKGHVDLNARVHLADDRPVLNGQQRPGVDAPTDPGVLRKPLRVAHYDRQARHGINYQGIEGACRLPSQQQAGVRFPTAILTW